MTEQPEAEGVSSRRDAVLWMWKAHNQVLHHLRHSLCSCGCFVIFLFTILAYAVLRILYMCANIFADDGPTLRCLDIAWS